MNTLIFQALWLISVVAYADVLETTKSSPTKCSQGWFGSECQYRCHCRIGLCDSSTGACTPDKDRQRCAKGWFGPACQYVVSPLKVTANTPRWLVDDDDYGTCNEDFFKFIYINLQLPHRFTWLRATTDKKGTFKAPLLTLYTVDGMITCDKEQKFFMDADQQMFDLICPTTVRIVGVLLSGPVVSHLCSLKVSAGRNLALRQLVKQSTTTWDAHKAVDGVTTGTNPADFCSSTQRSLRLEVFNMTLKRPAAVERLVLYDAGAKDPLDGSTLQLFSQNSTIIFNNSIRGNTSNVSKTSNVYIVLPYPNLPHPMRHLKLGKNSSELSTKKALVICEVEIYGEQICPDFRHGLECDRICNCNNQKEMCHGALGVCRSGCIRGYTGEDCSTECPKTRYGLNCMYACSNKCRNYECHPVTGRCLNCADGFPDCFGDDALTEKKSSGVDYLSVAAIFGLVCFSFLVVYLTALTSTKSVSDDCERRAFSY